MAKRNKKELLKHELVLDRAGELLRMVPVPNGGWDLMRHSMGDWEFDDNVGLAAAVRLIEEAGQVYILHEEV